MGKKTLKLYGRVKFNKLDVFIGIVAAIIAVGALWMSIGIAIADAGAQAGRVLLDVALGLGFISSVSAFGQSAVVSVYITFFFYGALLLLIFGTVFLKTKQIKGRVPGLVAAFVAAIGIIFFIPLAFEYSFGVAQGTVALVFPIVLFVFIACLAACIVFAVIATFNQSIDVEFHHEQEPEIEAQPEPEPEPEPEPQPEPEPEPEPEEEAEEAEEEVSEDEEGDIFSSLGQRRKRVPFENKMRRADKETRERYKMIVAALREYDFNDRKSIPGETFSYKREKLIFITFAGKTLKVHFRLDPKNFIDSPMPVKDASDVKKFEETPLYLKVKSNLAARRCIKLAEQIIEQYNVPKK